MSKEENYIDFNINHNIKVKLTDLGRKILEEHHTALYAAVKFDPIPPYVPVKEDEDGWSEWQLWVLMEQLGPHCHIGCDEPPFELVIRIPKPGEEK